MILHLCRSCIYGLREGIPFQHTFRCLHVERTNTAGPNKLPRQLCAEKFASYKMTAQLELTVRFTLHFPRAAVHTRRGHITRPRRTRDTVPPHSAASFSVQATLFEATAPVVHTQKHTRATQQDVSITISIAYASGGDDPALICLAADKHGISSKLASCLDSEWREPDCHPNAAAMTRETKIFFQVSRKKSTHVASSHPPYIATA